MSSLNKVSLIGNLGKGPEIRAMQSGDEVCSFSLATSESWKDKSTGEKKEKTEWHNIVIWNQSLVKIAKSYLKKGDKIYLEGKLETRKWNKDGVDHYTTEVTLKQFNGSLILLGGGKQHQQEATPTAAQEQEDEIPF
jgi:single-strand DNA-binding protein